VRKEFNTTAEKFEVGCQSLSSPPVELFNPNKTQPLKGYQLDEKAPPGFL